jgi:nucleoside-diphosphate-sugar epimerase
MTTAIRILVTGGTGFLGRHLVRQLQEADYEVTTLSRQRLPDVPSVEGDLTNPRLDLGGGDFSVVYHLAGLAHLSPKNRRDRRRFVEVNVQGTRNLLQALERTGRLPHSVVIVSSVAVYGRQEGVLLEETTPRSATDPYGVSKSEAEDVLTGWCARRGVRALVVRLPLVVGQDAPGNFGTMVRAIRNHRYFRIGDGQARHSMVLASDVAQMLVRLNGAEGVFHLTDGYHPSIAELENAICAALEQRPPRRLSLPAARVAARCADAIECCTGWSLPLNSTVLAKLTSTLTFSDHRARTQLGWRPCRVLDHIPAMVSPSS